MSQATPFILIVDDNATNLSVLSKALKADGYAVRMAMDGEQALALVQRDRPELILLDVEMPTVDGFETCRRLQADPETQGIPVIFMTALSETEHKVKGLSLGAVDYITKPFEQAEVLARVKVHWRLKRLTETLEQQVAERTRELQQTQVQLVQREKLSALGQLVAGVAHEINNPIGSIIGNIHALRAYIKDILGLLEQYGEELPQPSLALQEALDDIDLDYLRVDLPQLIRALEDGGARIKGISESLRIFSRVDSDVKQPFDLCEGLESTLLILRHRLKANESRPEIEVVKEYETLPEIQCFPGQLNQVFMNILANAIDAIDEGNVGRSYQEIAENPNRIIVRTRSQGQQVSIEIADNGKGIPPELIPRVFEYLFTTKAAGKGTGLGLAIARQIIVEKHQGQIDVKSRVPGGTEFFIYLPICEY